MPESTKVILPTAPVNTVTINLGMASTSWFDIMSLDKPVDNDFGKVHAQLSLSK
jgi:hypothetical protein